MFKVRQIERSRRTTNKISATPAGSLRRANHSPAWRKPLLIWSFPNFPGQSNHSELLQDAGRALHAHTCSGVEAVLTGAEVGGGSRMNPAAQGSSVPSFPSRNTWPGKTEVNPSAASPPQVWEREPQELQKELPWITARHSVWGGVVQSSCCPLCILCPIH